MYEDIKEQSTEIFRSLADHFACHSEEIQIKKQYGGGKSGDLVLLLSVCNARCSEDCGEYVLKIFCGKELPDEITKTFEAGEARTQGKILMPKLRHFGLKPAFYLYDVAGDSLLGATCMAELEPHSIKNRLEELSTALLNWNEDFQHQEKSIYEIILDWLGSDRLALGGRIETRLRNQISDELAQTFSFDDKQYPNPFYFILNENSLLNTHQNARMNCALYGKLHGDLNPHNVIVQRLAGRTGYEFYFIDFEHYRNNAPIFFDHAYILLSLLLDNTARFTLSEWCIAIETLFSDLMGYQVNSYSGDDIHLYMKAQKAALIVFENHQQPHNRKTVRCQLIAAHVAAGLNFLNKKNSNDRIQKFALVYAAIAMRTLLSALDIPFSESKDSPRLQMDQNVDVGLWHFLEKFSPDNRYVLITSGKAPDVTQDQLQNLVPIDWTMLIEVNSLEDNPIRENVLTTYTKYQGYRFYELPEVQTRDYESAPAWIHLNVAEEQINPELYYSRKLQRCFQRILRKILGLRENENLFLLVDMTGICRITCQRVLQDIVIEAGEHTPIYIAGLRNSDSGMTTDGNIHSKMFDTGLPELARSVYRLHEHEYNPNEVRIPCVDGIRRIPMELAANLQNDMQLVHHGIVYGMKDDNGDGFFHGSEATWIDISNRRDVMRMDYEDKWKTLIEKKLGQASIGAGSVLYLRHRPGGGGTTLSKRIAWDFCHRYPTVMLCHISNQTAERLKILYSETKLPLLIIAEVSDGEITQEGINAVRRDMISKSIRAVFLYISRYSSMRQVDSNENILYLPNGEDVGMTDEESSRMYDCFLEKLRYGGQENIEERIQHLMELTFKSEYQEIRQPFFYGLYAYEEDFHGVSQYVDNNIASLDENSLITVDILSMLTAYSQSVSLSFEETALFLFPEDAKKDMRMAVERVKEWMYANALIVRRERGLRICHPIIAGEILKKHELVRQDDNDTSVVYGTDKFVKLAKDFVDYLTEYYDSSSQRLNVLFHEIFTHREVVDEGEPKKFSELLTTFYTLDRCVDIMKYIADHIPENPHYKNHLARLYLYPVTSNQQMVKLDTEKALMYANQAIDCAKQMGNNVSIHYHVLGKVYTKQYVEALKNNLHKKKNLYDALKVTDSIYQKARSAFHQASIKDSVGYGLTGELELITKLLRTVKKSMHATISTLLTRNSAPSNKIAELLSEAGDLIERYRSQFDLSSAAFRNACMRFYEATGNLEKLKLIFGASAVSNQERSICNRAIASLLMEKGIKEDRHFSYDSMDLGVVRRIYGLMNRNIEVMMDTYADRIRWIETYRRLPEFSLEQAYQFLLTWKDADRDLLVCYYRYVMAFMLYCKTGDVTGADVQLHLEQTKDLSREAYGKNITATLNYYGLPNAGDAGLLVPRPLFDEDETKNDRQEKSKQYRNDKCQIFKGKIDSLNDGMVDIRFKCGDEKRNFLAKSPNIDGINPSDEGKTVRFYLGFSYSGMRAWDIQLVDDKKLVKEIGDADA